MNLDQKVLITGNGIKGRIIGIWQSVESATQYNVRFYDSTGRPCDFWFSKEELEEVN